MEMSQVPVKFEEAIDEVIIDKIFGELFSDVVESSLNEAETWDDFKSMLDNDLQSYIDDAKKLQKILCR